MSGFYHPPFKLGASQALDFTSTAASTGAASGFGSQTRAIRLAATAPCHVDVGLLPAADSTKALLHINTDLIVHVSPGERVGAIKTSGGSITSADGRLTIVELI